MIPPGEFGETGASTIFPVLLEHRSRFSVRFGRHAPLSCTSSGAPILRRYATAAFVPITKETTPIFDKAARRVER